MEPHTVIQVTPATPSSTDSSKTATILENLFDELQSFSKQSSIDSTMAPLQRSSGSLRGKHHHSNLPQTSDSLRKGEDNSSLSLHDNLSQSDQIPCVEPELEYDNESISNNNSDLFDNSEHISPKPSKNVHFSTPDSEHSNGDSLTLDKDVTFTNGKSDAQESEV